jgi:NAD(P)-dependent dehydrogenase (short-subunit alcohol dehydrogenase family)
VSDLPTPSGDRPVALVTGAARGLGLEVARQLGERGYQTLVAATSTPRASRPPG